MSKLRISLLIPTMNRPLALKRTLQNYFQGDNYPSQVVVVDQSEEDVIAKEIKDILSVYSDIVDTLYIRQEVPSLTKARNVALKYAKEEIVVCSDDDVDVYEYTLQNVLKVFEKSEIAMIAGLDDNAETNKSKIGYFLGFKSLKNRKIGHVTKSMLGRYPRFVFGQVETQWAMGYFFAFRKSLAEKYHLAWDEKLLSYAYAEDLDFSYTYYKAAQKEGLKCVLDEKVRVKHCCSKEYRIASRKSTFMYVCHRKYLSVKHNMGIGSNLALWWSNYCMLWIRRLRKEKPADFKDAIKFARKNKQDILQGKFLF